MNIKRQHGAQAVEFALVLPFLLAIVLMVVEFGFVVYNKAIITNASREAARAGTVLSATPWTTGNVAAVACKYAGTLLLSASNGTRTTSCSGTADPVIAVTNLNGNVPPQFGDPVTVRVSYPYQGFLRSWFTPVQGSTPAVTTTTSTWNLTAVSTMNHE